MTTNPDISTRTAPDQTKSESATPSRRWNPATWTALEKVLAVAVALVTVIGGLKGIFGDSAVKPLPIPQSETTLISVDGGFVELLGCGPAPAAGVSCTLKVVSETRNELAFDRLSTTLVDRQNRNYKPVYVQIGPEKGDIAHFPKELKLPSDGSILFEGLDPAKSGLQKLRIGIRPDIIIEFNYPKSKNL